MNEKGRRTYRFEIRLNEMENSKLTYDSLMAGIPKSEFIRSLIINNEVKITPDKNVYELIDNLTKIYIRLSQLVEIANNSEHIDIEDLKRQKKDLKAFVSEIEKIYL